MEVFCDPVRLLVNASILRYSKNTWIRKYSMARILAFSRFPGRILGYPTFI
jgi:hypothetical protein